MPPIDEKRVLQEFQKGRALGEKARSIYAKWGFSGRPFRQKLVYSIDDFFMDSQIYNFARWVGSFLSDEEINDNSNEVNEKAVFLIGPDAIGKTALIRKFVTILGNETHAKYLHIRNDVTNLETKPDDNELLIGLTGFEGAIRRIDLTEAQLLFLDDADILCEDMPRILEEISQNIKTNHITILIIRPSTYLWLWKNAPTILDEHILDSYKLTPLEKDAIIELIQRRIYHFKEKKTLQPFTQESLAKIADYSMGLPGLALELADGCLDFEIDTITWEYVDGKAKERHFETAKRIAEGDHEYWEGSRGEILRELTISLSPIEQEKLQKSRRARIQEKNPKRLLTQEKLMDSEGTSSAELVKRISLSSQGTTSYHLKKLIEGNVVEQIKVGRNQIYTLRPPMRNAVELALMSSTMLHS